MSTMTNTCYQHLLLEIRNGVAHVILNRPEKLNALGVGPGSNRAEIVEALAAADQNPDVKCILLRAAGPAFCGGGELSPATTAAERTVLDEHLFNQDMVQFLSGVRSVHKPVVCAVHGLCLGAALALIVQCDLVIAGDDARFGLIEGRIGHPGASELVPIIGAAWAKYMIFTGEFLHAERAVEIGLALTVVPASELLSSTTDLAERIARLPQEAMLLNKACINNVAEASGAAIGRMVGRAHDTITKAMSGHARAPDGRRFADIVRDEGVQGMKKAREAQFRGPWLEPKRKP